MKKRENAIDWNNLAEYVTRCVFCFFDVGSDDDISDQIERFFVE